MTFDPNQYELAPAGIVRAAAWPLESLNPYGNPELAELASGPCSNHRFEHAYRETMERERRDLWSRFRDDSLFAKALLLSSQSAHQQIQSATRRLDGPRNRAMRLAEHTLYRYLARAAGRPTPHALWAGVTELKFGSETVVEPLPHQCSFAPDMRPFQFLIRGLAKRVEYRHQTAWGLNPTLQAESNGDWVFLRRADDGHLSRHAIRRGPQTDAVLEFLRRRPAASLTVSASALAASGQWPEGSQHQLLQLLDGLAQGGVLLGGLDLPVRFDTVWSGLVGAADGLNTKHRRLWLDTISRLREHCADLDASLWAISTAGLAKKLSQAKNCVLDLARQFELPPVGLPATVIRCDLHLPWRLTLGHRVVERVHWALADYDTVWLQQTSPAAAYRHRCGNDLRRMLGGGKTLADGAALVADTMMAAPPMWPEAEEIEDAALAHRLRRWNACLSQPKEELTLAPNRASLPPPTAPLGCLFLGIDRNSDITVHSLSDVPNLISGRFAGLIKDHGVVDWLRHRIDREARQSSIAALELRGHFEASPNVLASPALTDGFVDPWGASSDSETLLGATVSVQPASHSLVLNTGSGEQAYRVLSCGPANLQSSDPLAQLLLLTSFHESPGRNQSAVNVPTAAELGANRFAPRLRLPRGAVLRNRRCLVVNRLPELLACRGSERFRRWQSLAAELGWPENLQVAAGAGAPLRIHRDSPLAVEALFKGVTAATPYFAVEETGSCAGLAVPGQGTFVTELNIPFARAPGA